MKTGRLIAAAIVLAALGAALFWSNHRKAAEDAAAAAGGPATNIISLKKEDISKLEIKKNDGDDVVLAKAGPENWKITSPNPLLADNEMVSIITFDLSPLKAEQVIEEKAGDLKAYGLAAPTVEVSATVKDGKSPKLLIGDDTPAGGMAYAMVEGDPRVFTINSALKANFNKGLADLRDKRLVPFDFYKVSKVELTGPKLNLTFGSDNGKYIVQNPKDLRADTSAVGDIVDKLRLATIDPGLSDADMKKSASLFSSGSPVATVKVTDPSGAQALEVRKNKDDYYAKSTAMDGAFKVSNELGAAINKSNEDFRDKRLFALGEDNPDKVELHDGPKSYFLTRSGEDWWSDGKMMNPLTVEDFLRAVRDLTAAKFVATGFSNPTINLTVTSSGGKQIEKAQIAKSGNDYIGKRADSATLYEIAAKAVEEMLKSADSLKPAMPPTAQK